jgi:hypothetical protein
VVETWMRSPSVRCKSTASVRSIAAASVRTLTASTARAAGTPVMIAKAAIANATKEPQAQNLAARKNAKNCPPRPATGADRATTVTCPPEQ